MSAQKGRPLTRVQRDGRRRNGQQSTGPRTPMGKKIVSLNAVKHGMYSCPPIQTMAVLGENPVEYIKLLTGPCYWVRRGRGGDRRPLEAPEKSLEAGVGDSGFGVRKSGLTDSGSEIDPNSEPRSPTTDVVGDGKVAEIGPLETSNFPKQSHQVVENTGEVSGIG